MRIHLPLHPRHFQATSSGPLAEIGGELVVIELQGELAWEGDKANGVVGVLGLDRLERPTLHLGAHHLLHGKLVTIPKPYAVIRRAAAPTDTAEALQGDAEDEESDADNEDAVTPKRRAGVRPTRQTGAGNDDEKEDEEDGPLFPDHTPSKHLPSSSPLSHYPSSARDYSSDLDSSPLQFKSSLPSSLPPSEFEIPSDAEEEAMEEEMERRVAEKKKIEEEREKRREEERAAREREERHRARRRAARPERTRHYEVVGVVRKKIVFALRPEPLVQPTELPE